jgi:hypothetical protein
MMSLCFVILALAMPVVSGQAPVGFSGTWVGEDTRMGAGGEAVESPIDAHLRPRLPRRPPLRELVLEERLDGVEVERPDRVGSRMSLPLTGLAVVVRDGAGNLITARALREGAALVVRREHQVRLPGGGEVLVEVEERHELLADGTLQVVTTSKAGGRVQTHRAVYRRVQ